MTWLFVSLAAVWFVVLVHDLRAVLALPDLPQLPPAAPARAVTAVLAVRDDGAQVGDAVRRLLGQAGVDLRVVAVDDRSRDTTGERLRALAASDPRLTVRRVDALPPGWLGKSHALQVGAVDVATPWLVFVDADARLADDALARAIAAAEAARADHVALLPTHRDTSFLGRACLLAFHLTVQRRVHAVNAPRQRGFVGTGAFNLVRTEAWRAIGGHEPLRLEVVDDVFLGALLARAGYRTRVWFAGRELAIDWGGTPVRLLAVVEKNMFAMLRFRTGLAGLAVAASLTLLGGTFAAPWLDGGAGTAALGVYLLTGLPALPLARRLGWSPLAAVLVPLTRVWLPIALLRSTWLTLRRGGVLWRDTFYPLAELRAGQVPMRP